MTKGRAVCILIFAVLVTLVGGWKALSLEREDNLLAFLPEDHPKIIEFRDIAESYGNTQIIFIGLQHSEGVTAKPFRKRMDALAKSLKLLDPIHDVVGLTTITDFTANPLTGALELRLLMDDRHIQSDELMLKDILSREHLVGSVISKDGKHTLMYAYVSSEADPVQAVQAVESEVDAIFDSSEFILGGAPVISSDIFLQTQRDLDALTPWSIVVIIVLLILAYRDLLGALIALVVTGGAITVAVGGLVVLGEPLNVVVSAAPIVLFAVGTAFSQHVLSHYFDYRKSLGPDDSLDAALNLTKRPLAVAALTSALGLGSFVVMDLEPVRVFGVFTASGILLSWLGARFVLPSFLTLVPLRPHTGSVAGFDGLAAVILKIQNRRLLMGGLATITIAMALSLSSLDSRVNLSALLPSQSRGLQSLDYIETHFGGGDFVFIRFKTDLENPTALHAMESLVRDLERIPGVYDVMHVGVLIARTYQGMVGKPGLPTSPAQASTLFGLLTGAPMVSQLVNPERNEALLQVRLTRQDLDGLETVLSSIRKTTMSYRGFAAGSLEKRQEQWARAVLGPHEERDAWKTVYDRLNTSTPPPTVDAVTAGISTAIDEGEWLVEVDSLLALSSQAVAGSWQAGKASPEAWILWLKAEEDVSLEPGFSTEDAWFALSDLATGIELSLRRDAMVDALVQRYPYGAEKGSWARFVDVFSEPEALSESIELDLSVNGLPVMYEGLSESVERNQLLSTGAALAAVIVVLLIATRSMSAVFWMSLPISMTLIWIYGAMSMLGIHRDIGTSMLSSLALGVGVDYAVHGFLSEKSLTRGTAAAIMTNATVVAAGFTILTFAASPPIRIMGALTAVAMLIAAFTTLIVYNLSGRTTWCEKET